MVPTGRPVTPIQPQAEASACTTPAAKDDAPPSIVAFFVLSAQTSETLISVLKEFMSSAESLNSTRLATLASSSNEDSTTTWLTHLEAARFLGISKATLYRYAEQGTSVHMCTQVYHHRRQSAKYDPLVGVRHERGSL